MENEIVISANKTVSSEYVAWFEELKSRYRSSQLKAGLSVNRELLQFNWNLFYSEKVHQAGGEILELMYKVPWRLEK